jgi:nucleoside phosphorylase
VLIASGGAVAGGEAVQGAIIFVASGGAVAGGNGLQGSAIFAGSGGAVAGGSASTQGDVAIGLAYAKYDFDFTQLLSGPTPGGVFTPQTSVGGTPSTGFGIDGTFWVMTMSTGGVSASGACGLLYVGCQSGLQIDVQSNSFWEIEWRVYIPDLSTSSQRFKVQAGFLDTALGANAEGVWFEYKDDVNSGQWVLNTKKTSGGAGSTSSNTAVAPVANTIVTLKIRVTGSSAEFFINGTSVGTIATNVPTANVTPAIAILKSVGTTARTFVADYLSILTEF